MNQLQIDNTSTLRSLAHVPHGEGLSSFLAIAFQRRCWNHGQTYPKSKPVMSAGIPLVVLDDQLTKPTRRQVYAPGTVLDIMD